jgi:hypothetical protein
MADQILQQSRLQIQIFKETIEEINENLASFATVKRGSGSPQLNDRQQD